tara:strand:- start:194 stop:643 length:450 start_codon:yes stop_codon:yes gene_type:complete
MNEEIKNQMLLNSDSYEFFLKQTREAERNFFHQSEKCIKNIHDVSDDAEDKASSGSRINIKKFKKAREAGEQFLVMSKKFMTEMEMMKKLSQNIFDSDLDVPEAERFELFENYNESIDKSIDLQKKVTKLITMEMKTLQGFETGEYNEE